MHRESSSIDCRFSENPAVVAVAVADSAGQKDLDVDFVGPDVVVDSIYHHVHVRGRNRVYRRLGLCILDNHLDVLDNLESGFDSESFLVGPAFGLPFAWDEESAVA